jgi:hypothetical protein
MQYIVLLSDLSYYLGLIGASEYEERLAIASWIAAEVDDAPDPRCDEYDVGEKQLEDSPDFLPPSNKAANINSKDPDDSDRWIAFCALNTWIFTKGDRDCYPSVPHGHLHKKNQAWPKLNPYNGRAYSTCHQELVESRLTKLEMKKLWNDADFVAHCREQIIWYCTFAPSFNFPNAKRGILRFPRW